jgi:hypothetical protein
MIDPEDGAVKKLTEINGNGRQSPGFKLQYL